MATFLLNTPVTSGDPGQATWSSSNTIVGPVLTNLVGEFGPLASPTTFPLAGVTIPANTLVDGAVIDITCAFTFDTFAAGGPTDVCLGVSVNGQNTQDGTGVARYIQLPAGPTYLGNITISAIFTTNGNQFVVQGMSFLDELYGAATVNGQSRAVGANVTVDSTLPCPIFPVVFAGAPDPGVTVSAGPLTAVVRLP